MIEGRRYNWRLSPDATGVSSDSNWNVSANCKPSQRQAIYLDLCRLLRKVDEPERARVLAELRGWAGLGDEGRPSHRPLTSAELCALESDELIEVGAHSVNHPSLAALPLRAQQAEISRSKSMIEGWVGKPITSFSYPFGGLEDYNAQTIRLVREAGFNYACANYAGTMTRGLDRFSMPRYLVRDWDGDEFASRLAQWNAA